MREERWLVTGASGQLGGHLLRKISTRDGASILALAGKSDVADVKGHGAHIAVRRIALAELDALRAAVLEFQPHYVIHTAAMTSVADAYARPQEAELLNTQATLALAEATAARGGRFLFTSTDMVFDGDGAPYAEGDAPTPPSVYGRTKVAAEAAIRPLARTLSVRVPLMFGLPATGRPSTFAGQLAALRSATPVKLFTDEFRTPLWNQDAADALVRLALSELTGLIHVPGPERLSRYEMIARVAQAIGAGSAALEPISRLSIPGAEKRPADLSLRGDLFARTFPQFRATRIDAREVLGQ